VAISSRSANRRKLYSFAVRVDLVRIPMKPATHSKRKPATCSDLKPAGIPI
jgi:hypothetical protein